MPPMCSNPGIARLLVTLCLLCRVLSIATCQCQVVKVPPGGGGTEERDLTGSVLGGRDPQERSSQERGSEERDSTGTVLGVSGPQKRGSQERASKGMDSGGRRQEKGQFVTVGPGGRGLLSNGRRYVIRGEWSPSPLPILSPFLSLQLSCVLAT